MSQQAEKDKTESITGLGRKTRDRKVESNDSPEIQDRGEDIRHPRPPFGGHWEEDEMPRTTTIRDL